MADVLWYIQNAVLNKQWSPGEKQMGNNISDHKKLHIVQLPVFDSEGGISSHHVLLLNFLWAFKSTTITVMLSLLPFWRARLERNSAAAWAAGSIPSPLSNGSVTPFFLCHRSIRLRARSHASSFVITSHKPSLAKMRHSSSLVRGRNITSGSGMIHGFKYLSPATENQAWNWSLLAVELLKCD